MSFCWLKFIPLSRFFLLAHGPYPPSNCFVASLSIASYRLSTQHHSVSFDLLMTARTLRGLIISG